MKMTKDEWIGWLKCNVLEIAILVLVLVLVVKAFSAPAVAGISAVPTTAIVEEPVVLEETSAEEAPTVVEVAVEVPLEEPATTGEVPVEEALTK